MSFTLKISKMEYSVAPYPSWKGQAERQRSETQGTYINLTWKLLFSVQPLDYEKRLKRHQAL